ncbi:uncharacterized protein LOC131858956 [Cryptomeria japonica]|uniref:uncharacterized protein LOC131858956 n=1 Tax=Cryptomeria japonica TaxID=3369 RepID=UPI0027DA046E|nr:uncharacterized protein LOC131858956 [Cryptomeria japonica]
MEGTTFAVRNLKSRNGGNNDAGSSSSDSTIAQGQAFDDEDGRQDGDPRTWDPPPDPKKLKDSQDSSLEVVKIDSKNIKEGGPRGDDGRGGGRAVAAITATGGDEEGDEEDVDIGGSTNSNSEDEDDSSLVSSNSDGGDYSFGDSDMPKLENMPVAKASAHGSDRGQGDDEDPHLLRAKIWILEDVLAKE